jgi:hypothetical protein
MNMAHNPAALLAALSGDFDNARVAATPGGIEAQEAAGQAMLCAAAQLPKEMHGCTREQLESIGFKFGADVDELFVTCTLPPGWKKQASDHSMHSDLLDDKGRRRAGIFYKAAFYDRRADLSISRRFAISSYEDGADDDHRRVVVKDGGAAVHAVGEYKSRDFTECDRLEKLAEAWLAERYPNWNDAFAYWD